ncbi:MAG: NADP-dependent malic enzyme [Planctomycetes bacterium]|nr:NADP-dependent malic enzyme [Planctomycetota bacterium]
MVDPREALDYHSSPTAGKLAIRLTKPCSTQHELSLAYTPGVAEPCRVIHKDPDKAYDFTAKGNLVAVISNGTAVLGLGDIGPLAGKPVMEGKAVLFKRFAGIDVFDIELDAHDIETFCRTVRALAPTFGGINLEDVKAPDCFVIEERLKGELDIPVFHDDQHGTAIITAAGLVNALRLQKKRLENARIVFSGAGAAALATLRLILTLGATEENILICDSKGVVHTERDDLGNNPYKARYARTTDARTLSDALTGADVFIGVSVANTVTPDMLRVMADRPIVFALANPDPEIPYPVAREARPDAIIGTGRSDFPNQVNNVLGFPFIFRGALDVRARTVNDEMMHAAVHALADLAREEVDDSVAAAYGGQMLHFGPEYVIPKPFDPRVLLRVAPAVAKAASDSGVARRPLTDVDAYRARLERLLGKDREIMRRALSFFARRRSQRIAFADGEHETVLRAAVRLVEQGGVTPVLVGRESVIRERLAELELDLRIGGPDGLAVHNPRSDDLTPSFIERLFERRGRRGMTRYGAERAVHGNTGFAAMLAREGYADGVVAGLGRSSFPEILRPLLQILGTAPGVHRAAGVHLMVIGNQVVFLTDTTLNVDPSAEELAEFAILTASLATEFGERPRVAMVSYSNFGAVPGPRSEKMRLAADLVRRRQPDLEVDGELHVDVAWRAGELRRTLPFLRLTERANVFVFPSLESGNVAQKIAAISGAEVSIGPILIGLGHPANVLDPFATVSDVVRTATITAMMAAGESVHDAVGVRAPAFT